VAAAQAWHLNEKAREVDTRRGLFKWGVVPPAGIEPASDP